MQPNKYFKIYLFWLLCGEGCGSPFNQRGGKEAQLGCDGRQDSITEGQAPSVSWKSWKASRISGVKGSGARRRWARRPEPSVCTCVGRGLSSVWYGWHLGGLGGVAYSSETRSNLELRQRRRRQSTRQEHTEERNPRALPWNSLPEWGAGCRGRSPARLLGKG